MVELSHSTISDWLKRGATEETREQRGDSDPSQPEKLMIWQLFHYKQAKRESLFKRTI